MKKTLAAVLAAAMALSTATVAFANDIDVESWWVQAGVDEVKTEIRYGKDVKLRITSLTFEDGGLAVSGSELSRKIDNGEITLTPVITEGNSALDSKPSVTVGSYKASNSTVVRKNVYTWTGADLKVAGYTFKNGETMTRIPVAIVGDTVYVDGTEANITHVLTISEFEKYKKAGKVDADSEAAGWMSVTKTDTSLDTNEYDAVQVKFKVKDTYKTGDTTIGIKFRVTIKKSDVTLNGKSYKKGDTLTSDEDKFKAVYGELDGYYEDMQLTLQEVDDRNVKLDASDLYDEIGNDTFTITFEDTAVFEAKLSASQKDVNLFYDLDEKTEVTDAYPNVDFEFITFRGNPSFVNSGTMTFNAVGGKNTQVYKYDGEALTPLTGSYDSTYNTVIVKGVKTLGTFVVASEILEEDEPDEPAEPVSSAPVVEEPEEDENPKTGAC